jgi:DNA repair protein RecN (Recombination protein N)
MLTDLTIRNFAIIDDLQLSLGEGLSIFTGETGAGKSIIVDALELLLGGRADTTAVRAGAEMALIEGGFRLDTPVRDAVAGILEREALLDDPGYVTLAREIRLEGRNICRVNGRVVNLGLLRELGEFLVDVHGQSEHLSLLQVRHHQRLLDRYAGLEDAVDGYREVFTRLREVEHQLAALRQSEQDSERRADLLAFQINEIEAAALEPGEEQALVEERARLANAERLASLCEQAMAALEEGIHGEYSASDLLGQAVEAIDDLSSIDPSLSPTQAEAQALLEQLGDLTRRLRIYRDSVEFNPGRLDEVEERVALIRDLSRKYGGSEDTILAHAARAREQLESITHASERLEDLARQRDELLGKVGALGAELTASRLAAGENLAEAIGSELQALNMDGAEFAVEISPRETPDGVPVDGRRLAYTATGLDQIEFMVAPNPGEGLKPLVKIASGGETSRLMLGLKGVLATADETPTLIFDEIDQGIGGRVGAIVGQKLWTLAQSHQVLCITHLPQLAAFGDRHFKVEKVIRSGRTITVVRPLEGETRNAELAQMLGGESEPNLESARQLLKGATAAKTAGDSEAGPL